MLSIPFHIVFLHHSHITDGLRIIQPLLKFVHSFTLTLFNTDPRLLHDLSDLELPGLNKVYASGPLTLPVHDVPPLVLSLLQKESELAECGLVDPLADLEAHEEVEHAVEALLDLAQTHPLEVLLRQHCQVGRGQGRHGRRSFKALGPVHKG